MISPLIFFKRNFFSYIGDHISVDFFLLGHVLWKIYFVPFVSWRTKMCHFVVPCDFRKQEPTMSRLELVFCLLFCSMECPWKRSSWILMSWKPSQCTKFWRPQPSSKERYTWWVVFEGWFWKRMICLHFCILCSRQ